MNQQNIAEKLRSFKGIILDGDGVLFTGKEYRGALQDGMPILMKERDHHDGQGLSFLRAIGIHVLFASFERGPLESLVKKLNELPSVQSGAWEPIDALVDLQRNQEKTDSIDRWLADKKLTWSECAYIGDDRSDFEALRLSGLKIVPANGRRVVKNIADIVLESNGGDGAIREFAEMALDARGIDESTLPAA